MRVLKNKSEISKYFISFSFCNMQNNFSFLMEAEWVSITLTAPSHTNENTFGIGCTGDAVTGDHIQFTEAVFEWSYRRASFVGMRTIEAIIEKDSYGSEKQQHTFSLRVTRSEGCEPIEIGKLVCRKGRNVYWNGTYRKLWEDEEKRKIALDEKHQIWDGYRNLRDQRRSMEVWQWRL